MRQAILIVAMLMAFNARAAERLLAVLPLDTSHAKGKLDADARAGLEETIRDVAIRMLAHDGWTVLTGETTLQILADNGVDASKCGDQSCHLSMARELKAEAFVSGVVQWDDGFIAFIRFIESKSGRIIASQKIEGATTRALRESLETKGPELFAQLGTSGSQTPAAPEVAAPPTSAQAVVTHTNSRRTKPAELKDVLVCDALLQAVFRVRDELRERVANNSGSQYDQMTLAQDVDYEANYAQRLKKCAELYGPLYGYTPLAQPVRRSTLSAAAAMTAPQCTDLEVHISEFTRLVESYVSGPNADNLDAPAQAEQFKQQVQALQSLRSRCAK